MKTTLIKYVYILVASLFVTTACTHMVDDAFEQSSSERIDEFSKNVKEVLQAAPNGWQAQYYASRTYGGYNVFCKFEGDSVTIASEKVGDSQNAGVDENGKLITSKTRYKMEQSMGSILSFDTYNTVFHYFSEPKSDFGDAGSGMAGDFEFRVKHASQDSVILEGKKHQSRVVMLPIDNNSTWEKEYETIKDVEKQMSSRTYYLWNGVDNMNVTVTTSYRRLKFDYVNEEEVATTEYAPYIVTKDGYKFYEPITIKGVEMEGFNLSDDGYYPASNNNNVKLESMILPPYEHLSTSMWFITYDNLGKFAQPYWDDFKEALEKAGPNETKATLYWALIGKYSGKLGFHMNAGGDKATIGFAISKVDEEGKVVTLKYDDKNSDKAGKNFYDKYKLKEALKPFIGNTKLSKRTFSLEVDNPRRPSYMILTDQNEPTNVIKLLADQVNYPFGDEPEE